MLNNEILEVINKNLPSHVGEVLKKRIEQIEKLENDNKRLLVENERYKKIIDKFESMEDKYATLEAREKEFKEKKYCLDEKERNFKLEIAELKIIESQKREDLAIDLVKNIFRNSIYRSSIHKEGFTPVATKNSDGSQFVSNGYHNFTEITEKEEV